ncbi:hypothetical protein [Salmonella enterica]|uniref:hypothetical protein n=1 Tax=Salmonella enterica TaxID=28901 RepID=UPI000DEC9666|nr:hypothetical protein [Salmonella enterica]AXD10242.1 hypothetical protein CHE29_15785 [Salmonella enterica]
MQRKSILLACISLWSVRTATIQAEDKMFLNFLIIQQQSLRGLFSDAGFNKRADSNTLRIGKNDAATISKTR